MVTVTRETIFGIILIDCVTCAGPDERVSYVDVRGADGGIARTRNAWGIGNLMLVVRRLRVSYIYSIIVCVRGSEEEVIFVIELDVHIKSDVET